MALLGPRYPYLYTADNGDTLMVLERAACADALTNTPAADLTSQPWVPKNLTPRHVFMKKTDGTAHKKVSVESKTNPLFTSLGSTVTVAGDGDYVITAAVGESIKKEIVGI